MASIVAVCFKCVLGVKEASEIDIAGALVVHHRDLFGVEDAKADLEGFWRLLRYVPVSSLLVYGDPGRVDLDPHFNCSLRYLRGRVINISLFNWFVLQGSPLWQEVSVFKVNYRRSN